MESFDVIIVGAGPAGGLLGYYLARQCIRTLIIEKRHLPRSKVCGGGLTRRSLDIIPFDISEVIEHYSYTVNMTVNNRCVFQHASSEPVIGMVMRNRFDHFLIQKAVRQGARVADTTTFRSASGNPGRLTIETSNGRFQTKLLVGADGVYGKTAREIGLSIHTRQMIGLEAEVFPYDKTGHDTLTSAATFDFGGIPKGYGWMFPKTDHLSMGVVSVQKKTKGMKKYLARHLEAKALQRHSTIQSLRGWAIPYGPPAGTTFENEKGLLIGDAAGLTDPITGEGIFYALTAARFASEAIADKLRLGKGNGRRYQDAMESLRKDLAAAVELQQILFYMPRASYTLMKLYGRKLGRRYIDIITGKMSYTDLHRKIFSSYAVKLLWMFHRKDCASGIIHRRNRTG